MAHTEEEPASTADSKEKRTTTTKGLRGPRSHQCLVCCVERTRSLCLDAIALGLECFGSSPKCLGAKCLGMDLPFEVPLDWP